jgi:hypothetical protein
MLMTEAEELIVEEMVEGATDPSRFNDVVLGRDNDDGFGNRGYWSRQKEIAESVVRYPTTLACTGNGTGKSFVAAGEILRFLGCFPGSMVLCTAPSQVQLQEVLWKEVERAYTGSRIPLGARVLKSPLKIDFGGGWEALGYSTTKTERFSGHHSSDLLFVGDEASGIAPEIYEAVGALNPSRTLLLGNPLRPSGDFYERCRTAKDNPDANLIQVSSLESPHINLPRSPWGLADQGFLTAAIRDFGELSAWFLAHVLGKFPTEDEDAVFPHAWLDRAGEAGEQPSKRSGFPRLAIDLGEGKGGDRTVLGARDDNSLLALEHSRTMSLEAAATRASILVQRFGIEHHRVSWDVGGIGSDFANRLEAVGIVGARPWRGGEVAGKKFSNRRTAGAWHARQRLDPNRLQILPSGVAIPMPAFAIRPDWMTLMRKELQGLLYHNVNRDKIELETKKDYMKRLGASPDFADMMGQLFYFTD